MTLTVIVHPRSKEEKIVKIDRRYVEVFFNVLPEKGKANEKLISMLSGEYNVPKSKIIIKHGHRSRMKIVEIL